MSKINIIGIAGSVRENSYNLSLLRFIKKNIAEKINFKIVDISNLPMFNEDIEQPSPKGVEEFRHELEIADAFIMATPEHNYSIPALLKNALDWASRSDKKILNNKYVALISASPSMLGGSRAQYQLRYICLALNLKPLNRPEVFINNVHEKIDINGEIIDEQTKKRILELVTELLSKISK